MYIIGIDIGGTFTDLVVLDEETGRTVEAKSPTTPNDLQEGVFNALDQATEQLGCGVDTLLARTRQFSHSTTQTSNVVFTLTGAKVGLLTTRGMEDQILMMRGIGRVAGLSLAARRHPRATDKPALIVDETRIRGVKERVDWKGAVVTPLDEAHAATCIRDLLAEGVEAIAISLLWSFKNPSHEQRLAELVRAIAPHVHVSISSSLVPVRGEYERTATTIMNAYCAPTLEKYLDGLNTKLSRSGLRPPMLVVQSNGGVTRVDQVTPVQTIESGPAVGVVAAQSIAADMGLGNVIATDVGGTTFKVSVLAQGKWATSKETVINQYGLWLPMVDVVSIGAGGGSIAWVDDVRLRVGPQSAQADPGPVAYGKGGREPTVTDADLVLGYLNPDYFWGGRLQLDLAAARTVIGERVAAQLFQGDWRAAGAGIREVMDHQMADLIRKATIQRGYDPRDFTMISYGGMGPVHCNALAREAGIRSVLVPLSASVLSAYGAAVSDIRHSFAVSDMILLPAQPERINPNYERMEGRAHALLGEEGVAPADRIMTRWVDMRYRRQMHEVRVSVPVGALDEAAIAALVVEFERRYATLYGAGAAYREAGVEMVTFGVEAVGRTPKPLKPKAEPGGSDSAHALKGERSMYCALRRAWVTGRVYDGLKLRPGNQVVGLAAIEFPQTTVLVEHDSTATVDPSMNILLDIGV